ncbi:O-antigen/teichoic acid export membrane protein [Salirhabdus euzebyi]|uniref:O-antigen/teichoic acid export membrane protein n=1 Tax=Salirhabdus euzebyi TaxID=394506 RepID=A0A841Q4K5_9BACI|nr:oligosaccharide flippase family protein [Salirhabdus euzebyi]MBB6453293.1 O-antigen/teichoic acid export membrane protein [Salirhabdus euzebyi]
MNKRKKLLLEKRKLEKELRYRRKQKLLLLQKKELKRQLIQRKKEKEKQLQTQLQEPNITKPKELFIKLKQIWNNSQFLSKVIVIAGGTAAAQGLQVVFSPVLTRLYSPDDFGLLTIFISIVAICSKIVDFRYSLAIPLPKKDDKALNILTLSLSLILFITLFITFVLWMVGELLFSMLQAEELTSYIWVIGLSIFGIGIYQTLNQYAIRQQAYVMMTMTKMNQSVVQIAVQLICGFLKIGNIGLLLGDALGRMSGSGLFASLIWRKHKQDFHKIKPKKMWEVAREYRRFPLFSTWSALLNGASLQITPLIIAMNYGTAVAGLWALGQRVVGGPMGLIGTAVAQVFLGEGSKFAREHPKRYQSLFYRTAKNLFLVGLIPTIVIIISGPWLFQLVFGDQWMEAGKYVQLLALMYLAQLTMSPLSSTLDVLQKQDWELVWDIVRVIFVVSGLLLASFLNLPPIYAVLFYAIVMLVAYVVLFFLCTIAIKQFIKNQSRR